jgi:large subunit ribosomal protein L17
MRHAMRHRKLGRTSSHREALFRNQLQSLMVSERIITTLPKAKELRPIAEKIVTKGKRGTVDARRQVRRWIAQRELVKKLFDEVAPRFQERNGGYLRILKLGPRPGDGAEMAFLEFVDYQLAGTDKKAKAEKAGKGKGDGKGKSAKDEGDEAEASEKPAKKAAKPPAKAAPRKPPVKPTSKTKAPTKPPAGAKKRSTPRKAGSE